MKASTMLRKRLFAVFLLVAFIVGSIPMVTADEGRAAFDWESEITVANVAIDATPHDLDPVKYKNDVTKVTVNVANIGDIYLTDIEVAVMVYWWNATSEWELNFTYAVNTTDYLDIAGNGDDTMDLEFYDGVWANDTAGTWNAKATGKYQINASVTAIDVELADATDFALADFEFKPTVDVGIDAVWLSGWTGDPFEDPLPDNGTCIDIDNGTFGLTVDLASLGVNDPTADVTVSVRVTDTSDWSWLPSAGGAGAAYPYWITKAGAWDTHFWFSHLDDLYTFSAGTYAVEVNISYLPESPDEEPANNQTNITFNFCTAEADLAPSITNFMDAGTYDDGTYAFEYKLENLGLADFGETNAWVNISVTEVDNHDYIDWARDYLMIDITGGAELALGETLGDSGLDLWTPANVTGTYWINITSGPMVAADTYTDNNVSSIQVTIESDVKSIDLMIDTPATGEYPSDYGLSVNCTVINDGDISTAAEGGDINVTLEMYVHGGAMVYSKVMALGDHLGAGASNTTVIFDVAAVNYELNTNYDILVWVNVTDDVGVSQYDDAGDSINVTFHYPPNGTIDGVVTGAPADYQVMATDGVYTYYALTDATGNFAFPAGTFDWATTWDVSFDGRYMYADDEELGVIVGSAATTPVTLTTTMFPKALVSGTLAVTGDDGNLNVTMYVTVKDIKDTEGDSAADLVLNEDTGLYDWDMFVYKEGMVVNDTVNITATVPAYAQYFEMDYTDPEPVIYEYINASSQNTSGVALELTYDPGLEVIFASMDGIYVDIGSNIKIAFDEAILNATIDEMSIMVNGTGVPDYNVTDFTWTPNNMNVTLDLPGDLTKGETYTLTVTKGVLMEGDKAYLPWAYEFEFDTPPAGGTVSGVVTDLLSAPLLYVNVTLGTRTTETDALGAYIFEGVAEGLWDMGVTHTKFLQESGPANVTVGPGEVIDDADFTMKFWPFDNLVIPDPFPVDANLDLPFLFGLDNTSFVLDDGVTANATLSMTYDDGIRAMAYVGGAITYDNVTFVMTFDPTADLLPGTTYTFGISGDILDSNGMRMGYDIDIDLTTAVDDIRELTAAFVPIDLAVEVALDAPVTITFNYPVNTTAAEPVITATGFDILNYTWDNTSMVVILVHADFVKNTSYTVSVADGLASTELDVIALAADSATFTTIVGDDDIVYEDVEIMFGPFYTVDLDELTAEDILSGDFDNIDGADATLTICGYTYTATVSTGNVEFTIPAADWEAMVDCDENFTLRIENVKGHDGYLEYTGQKSQLLDIYVTPDSMAETEGSGITPSSDGGDDGDSTMIYAIIGIVIVVIILLLVFASRGKKEEEEMPAEDEAGEAGEFECPSCGAMVSSDIGECPECGEVFEEDQFRCPECGAEVEPGMEECAECGETLEIPERPEGEEGEVPEGEEGEEPEGDDFDVESEEEEPMEAFEDEEEEDEDEEDEDDDEDDDDDELDLDEDEDEDEEEE